MRVPTLNFLVTSHELAPLVLPALAASAVLILVTPLGVMACLLPLRWTAREGAFVAWAGLRGAAPVCLAIVGLLADIRAGRALSSVRTVP